MKLAYRILRKWRGYVLPSHRETFREVVKMGALRKGDEERKFVFFDFGSSQIDVDAGRYAFAIVRDFEEAGYTACYRTSFGFLSSMRYKRYKELLLEREFRVCDSPGDLPDRSVAAIVTDRKVPSKAVKTLRVSYENRLPRKSNEVTMPFRVYPKLYSSLPVLKEIDRERVRPWRCFFAGTVTERYGRKVLERRFGKMSRVAVLKALKLFLEPNEFHELSSENQSVPKRPGFVLATKAWRIPPTEWFRTLGNAEFFLACPGGTMPICHNLPEAMAAGAIPILEYPEYLDPQLKDGENCLVFSGPRGLVATMRRAFEMKAGEIARMRRAAEEYYQRHLAPGLFAREVMLSPERELTMLFNAPHVRR